MNLFKGSQDINILKSKQGVDFFSIAAKGSERKPHYSTLHSGELFSHVRLNQIFSKKMMGYLNKLGYNIYILFVEHEANSRVVWIDSLVSLGGAFGICFYSGIFRGVRGLQNESRNLKKSRQPSLHSIVRIQPLNLF